MNKNIINMTPHPINLLDDELKLIVIIPVSGKTIRLTASTIDAGFTVDDIRITKTVFGEPIGLPEYNFGKFYLVSQLVKAALPERSDLLVPAEIVRDDEGNIIGCKSFGI